MIRPRRRRTAASLLAKDVSQSIQLSEGAEEIPSLIGISASVCLSGSMQSSEADSRIG